MQKTFKISLGIVVVLVAGIGITLYIKKHDTPAAPAVTLNRNLTADQKKIYTDRIASVQTQIKALSPNQGDYKQRGGNLHMYLAEQYYGLGMAEEANKEFEAALKLDDKNFAILTAWSVMQTEQKNYLAARASLEKALELAPYDPDLWIRYISLVQDFFPENREEVDDYFDKALKSTSRQTNVLIAYAQFLERKGKESEAVKIWKEVIDKEGPQPAYLNEYKRLGGK